MALAERRQRGSPKLALVWAGEAPGVGRARHTRVVLAEGFARGRERVLVAGNRFGCGAALFESLHRSMVEHGVRAYFFVAIEQPADRLTWAARVAGRSWALLSRPLDAPENPINYGRAAFDLFLKTLWPFDDLRPARLLRPAKPHAAR